MIRKRAIPAVLHRPSGFTLVEALVALVVLSVGLLGIAALYVETLRANRTALHRTEAVNLATDIADRMRSNRNPANAYACGSPCDPAAGGNDIADEELDDWVDQIRHSCREAPRKSRTRAGREHAGRVRRRHRLERSRPGRPRDLPAADRDLRAPK